jgi:hypothetical protein
MFFFQQAAKHETLGFETEQSFIKDIKENTRKDTDPVLAMMSYYRRSYTDGTN